MMRIHLCQMNYLPAYYEAPQDWLSEPSFFTCNSDFPLSQIRGIDDIEYLLIDNRDK